MFKVYEMMGNSSKEVTRFETEEDASEYVLGRWNEYVEANYDSLEKDESGLVYEDESNNFYSYFSIEDDGRKLISRDDLIEEYNDMLDECYPEMFNMCPSIILQRADPIQYNCGLNDFYDSISDLYYCEEME